MSEKSVYLFCSEQGADKEYHAHLRAKGDGWVVDYANGPRGRVGKSKAKTASPLSLEAATKVFDALVKSKMKQNPPYTLAESGVRFTNTEDGERFSGYVQQQPSPIDGLRAASLDSDPAWAAQQKANGERRPVEILNGLVQGINKRGYYVNVPETWAREFLVFGDASFDGEHVGETLYVFDLLSTGGKDLRAQSFESRYRELVKLLESAGSAAPSIRLLEAAFTTAEKKALLEEMTRANHEGMVYKRLDAPYEAGRVKDVLKYPFYESSTCVVLKQNVQRSVLLGLKNSAGSMIEVGNVTIPESFAVPAVNDLCDIRYLYFNPGGAFEQPVYLGPNREAQPEEALLTQISRFKPGIGMDELGRRVVLCAPQEPAAEEADEASPGQVERMRA